MATRRFRFPHTFILVNVSFLVLTGCGTRTHTATLTGDFFNKRPSGTIVVPLARGNILRETITLDNRTPQVIDGHWHICGQSIEFEPFVDIEQNTPVLYRQWKASAQYDLHGDFNWFIRQDENVYFERVHPMTLAWHRHVEFLLLELVFSWLQHDHCGSRKLEKIFSATLVQAYTPAYRKSLGASRVRFHP